MIMNLFGYKKSVFEGTLSPGFLGLGVKNVRTFKLIAFSRTQNTPRTSREGNQMTFPKEGQDIVSGNFSSKLRKNLKTPA